MCVSFLESECIGLGSLAILHRLSYKKDIDWDFIHFAVKKSILSPWEHSQSFKALHNGAAGYLHTLMLIFKSIQSCQERFPKKIQDTLEEL
jgi:hypothetical protein